MAIRDTVTPMTLPSLLVLYYRREREGQGVTPDPTDKGNQTTEASLGRAGNSKCSWLQQFQTPEPRRPVSQRARPAQSQLPGAGAAFSDSFAAALKATQGNSKLKKASQHAVHGARLVAVAGSWEAEGGEGKALCLWGLERSIQLTETTSYSPFTAYLDICWLGSCCRDVGLPVLRRFGEIL